MNLETRKKLTALETEAGELAAVARKQENVRDAVALLRERRELAVLNDDDTGSGDMAPEELEHEARKFLEGRGFTVSRNDETTAAKGQKKPMSTTPRHASRSAIEAVK